MSGFGRSNSLSINTGASLFGSASNNTPAPAGGLFGASKPPPSGGLFGTSTNTSQPSSGSGLFGAATNTSQPQSASLFGSSTNTSQAPSGGLFGSSTTAAQPQRSQSLFGNLGSSTQQNTGTSLFGQNNAQSKPQTPSLFGGTLGAQNQSQQQAGGLFGNAQNNQQQQAGGLFSNTQNNQQQQSGGLFAPNTQNTQNAAPPSLFGATTNTPMFGGSATIQGSNLGGSLNPVRLGQPINVASTISGVQIVDPNSIRSTTRFNDLHPDIQKQIEQLDNLFQQYISESSQITAALPGHKQNLSYIPNDVAFLQGKLDTVELALENDSVLVQRLKQLLEEDVKDAKLSFTAVENQKLPPSLHYGGGGWPSAGTTVSNSNKSALAVAEATGLNDLENVSSADVIAFITKRVEGLRKSLDEHNKRLVELEGHLGGVEATTMRELEGLVEKRRRGAEGQRPSDMYAELRETLRFFEEAIWETAKKVGEVREKAVEVQFDMRSR
ncbi:hypothetical protein M501DRAFT_1004792 [Patellaria atrata CBS 101060]|uniref:Nucleoporin Nup54 alpha-helical domain-containing protein n=1 Tax=Patellaria atrata CBS 101060 TaxID=1346257 RepID=A0A9P4SBS1_9PEZI|nr:hypothetical protein M501DRAFT_1004792 [Patellaria atrata CBS 101060]